MSQQPHVVATGLQFPESPIAMECVKTHIIELDCTVENSRNVIFLSPWRMYSMSCEAISSVSVCIARLPSYISVR